MTNNTLSSDEYDAKLISLTEACPVGRKNPSCPMSVARKKNFSEKLEWVNSLTPQEKKEIYEYHIKCFSRN